MAGRPWSSGRSWRSRGVNSAPVSGELVALPVRLGQSRGVLYWKSDWLGLSSSRWARLAESCIGNRGVRDCVSAALQAMSRFQRDTTLCKRYNTCKVWYRCENGTRGTPGSMVATTGREPLIGAGKLPIPMHRCPPRCGKACAVAGGAAGFLLHAGRTAGDCALMREGVRRRARLSRRRVASSRGEPAPLNTGCRWSRWSRPSGRAASPHL